MNDIPLWASALSPLLVAALGVYMARNEHERRRSESDKVALRALQEKNNQEFKDELKATVKNMVQFQQECQISLSRFRLQSDARCEWDCQYKLNGELRERMASVETKVGGRHD